MRLTHVHTSIIMFVAAGVALSIILGLIYFYLSLGLPDISSLKNYRPPAVTEILDRRGEPLAYWYKERRFPVPLSQMPPYLIQAFVSAEDARFYEHKGVDFLGILRAAIKDIKARAIVQGGSTITQQVVRSLLLSKKKSFIRKLKEAILAWEIDSALSKDEILNIYLNQIYLGAGAYGVEAAARTYFDKHVWELTLPEAALIAGLTPAPSRYNPLRNPRLALKRRAYVLRRMAEEGYITLEEARKAARAPLVLHPADFSPNPLAGYFLDALRSRLERRLGEKELLTGGYTIYTTLDLNWQEAAQEILQKKLKDIPKRHPGQKRIPQGAIVCFDNATGGVRILIGGRDYEESQYNRALQARRQPGSAFKPIIWSAALEKRLVNVSSLLVDEPVVLPGSKPDSYWQPKNFDHDYLGPISLRTALVHSRNTIAVKLALAIGLPDLRQTATLFGITSPISPDYSIALGSSGVSLFEITHAYTVFPNQGYLVKPRLVESIFDRDGKEVPFFKTERRPVISQETAYIMTYLLEEVIRDGTGRCARSLGVPAGGKTGTTDNYHDAWFIGFTKEVTCGVWVGHDNLLSLGRLETGARAACPIWLATMERRPQEYSGEDFEPPEDIVFVKTTDLDPLRGKEELWMPYRDDEVPEPKPTWPKFLGIIPIPRIFWW